MDQDNNRVLSFPDAEGFGNGDPATVELGQPDFFSYFPNQNSAFPNGDVGFRQTIPAIPAGLWAPSSVAVDAQGDVYVADTLNNRVLMFPAPIVNGEAATMALGQPDLITNTCVSPTAASLCGPQGVAIDSLGEVMGIGYRQQPNRLLRHTQNRCRGGVAYRAARHRILGLH